MMVGPVLTTNPTINFFVILHYFQQCNNLWHCTSSIQDLFLVAILLLKQYRCTPEYFYKPGLFIRYKFSPSFPTPSAHNSGVMQNISMEPQSNPQSFPHYSMTPPASLAIWYIASSTTFCDCGIQVHLIYILSLHTRVRMASTKSYRPSASAFYSWVKNQMASAESLFR